MKPWMLLVVTIVFPLNAAAQTDMEENVERVVAQLKKERAGGRSYGPMMTTIDGAGRGIAVANANLSIRKQAPLYCLPDNITLTGGKLVDITIEQYERDKSMGVKTPPFANGHPFDALVFALFKGLQRTFPCK